MQRNSSPCHNLRKSMASVWPFVVCLFALSLVTMAQTIKTNSKSLLAVRAAARTSDLKVSFTYGPKFPTEGQTVQFVDASTGSPTSWRWDFGDGSTSSEQNPSHKYLTLGFRKVTLLATSRAGSKKSSKIISIMPEATIASFIYSPTTPGPGQTVLFADTTSGDPTFWQWNFGDGSISTAKNPSHVFLKASFYTVTLVSSNSSGSKQGSKTITVASMSFLGTSFNYAPALPSVGQAVQFTDTSAGSPTSWLWDFGDGMSSTAINPVHNFSAAGFYNVTLTVAGGSETKSMSRSITVTPAPILDASFTFNPTSPADGQAILFTDTSIGSPTSWLWDFADGTTSTSQSLNHTYASPGSYNVILTITNGSNSDSMSQTINVSPDSMLAADFTYSPSSPILGQSMNFSDTSAGSPASWEWDFGDGATTTVRNPSHTYAAAGAQSVTLTVKAGSNSSSINKTISVTYADVIQAASPSFADVKSAIASAKSGDTVMVPAGRATWDQQLVLSKGVKIIGAGVGQTVITSGYNAPTPNSTDSGNTLIYYRPDIPSDAEKFRLSGFTFDLANRCGLLHIKNHSAAAIRYNRIDNNQIKNTLGYRTIYIFGTIYGVIDSNTMDNVGSVLGSYGANEISWTNLTFEFGTADNLYFEDNVITGLQSTPHSGGAGGRYCVRHNTYTSPKTAGIYPWFDMHGNQDGGNHATMGAEIYENTLTMVDPKHGVGIFDQRGGKALIYNNHGITNGSVSAKCREEYSDSITPPAINPISGQPQHISDSNYWGNRKNDNTLVSFYIPQTIDYGGTKGLVPQANRDYWDESASFDGTTGVGVGLLAARPKACTKGVAYWATDTKMLYKCTATNIWNAYYAPYTYPHPLRAIL